MGGIAAASFRVWAKKREKTEVGAEVRMSV